MNNGENSKKILKELLEEELTENSRQLALATKEVERTLEKLEENIEVVKSHFSIGAISAINATRVSRASVEFDVALGKLDQLVKRQAALGIRLEKLR